MPEPFVIKCDLEGPVSGALFVIYKITHVESDRAYIGLSRQGALKRIRLHWKVSNREDTLLYRAMRKYGRSAFSYEIVAIASSVDDLPALEVKAIADCRAFVRDGGFNMTRGGEGSPGICDEVRENMRVAAKARMQDPAVRAKISSTLKGRKLSPEHVAKSAAGHVGKPLSAAHKASLAAAMRKRSPLTQEQRDKISKSLSGRRLTPERIKLTSDALRGRKRSAETLAKIAAVVATPVHKAKISAAQKLRWARWREQRILELSDG